MGSRVLVRLAFPLLAATFECACASRAPAPSAPPPADWTTPGVEVLATGPHESGELALGNGGIWWVDASGGVLGLLNDKPFPFSFVTGLDKPSSVAIDGASVFWSDSSGISMCTAPGCAGRQMLARAGTKTPGTGGAIEGIVFDEQSLYWVEGGEVRSCPRSGCPAGPTVRATGQAINIELYHPLAADAANLYWVRNGGVAVSMPKAGGAPSVIARGGPSIAGGVAVDSTAIYWIAFDLADDVFSAELIRAPLGGGAITVLESFRGVANDLAVDDTSVYYTAIVGGMGATGNVVRVDKTTGAGAESIAGGEEGRNAGAIAIDNRYVYWGSIDGVIRRCAK